MAKKEKGATAKDAHILLELYRLRCEPTMRKARTFMTGEFWPQSYEEFRALLFDFGTEHNAWARQVFTYWDMACAMVLSGAVNEELFVEVNGEPFFIFAKYKNFLPQFRKEFIDPEFATRIEKLVNKSVKAKERVKRNEAFFKARAAQAAAAAAKAGS